MSGGQNYASQSPNSYGTMPMTSVIQHRMSGNHSNLTTHNPLPSPHQRLGPSPSSCSVGSNFYAQGSHTPHPISHTPVPTPTPTPSATPTLQQQQQHMNSVPPNANAGSSNPSLTNQGYARTQHEHNLNKLEMKWI